MLSNISGSDIFLYSIPDIVKFASLSKKNEFVLTICSISGDEQGRNLFRLVVFSYMLP